MSKTLFVGISLAITLCLPIPGFPNPAADYSKEAAVIQSMITKVSFAPDGAREWQQTLSIRVQSEASVRQFGVLAFSYAAQHDQISIDYVRVKKADGSVVDTPASSIQDLATQIATEAPTYSDLRQKQVPVKALGVGDVLEYSVRSVQSSPEIPGQFWYTQFFVDDSVVLSQSIEITVPKGKYVQVASPGVTPAVHDEEDRRTYVWKHSHLEPSKPDDKKDAESKPPKVEMTSFRSWEEVGQWWATLANPQADLTPEIAAKAKELTAGLSSNLEKEKALYNYVGQKFRYISISLGAGRYRPHSAAEVLANQYGDCKDKHTLFVSLLKAAGIQAWPALVGAGIKFDAGMPSPAQFNHVVTVIPQGGKYLWLDTTAEVAPFGLLNMAVRDQNALVIPAVGAGDNKPALAKTPLDPPLEAHQNVNVKASLSEDGVLTGHFDFEMTGDAALDMRSAFRQVAPAQWQALAQQISYALNFGGEVSGVDVQNIEDTDKPFRLSYEYKRKDYSGWKDSQITMPLPPLGFGPGSEADKPKEPFWAGARGTTIYRATLQLPRGFSAQLPSDTNVNEAFANYTSHYSSKDGTLTAERQMTIKKAKVGGEDWAAYQKFSKSLQTDGGSYLTLSKASEVKAAAANTGEADRLMALAYQAAQKRDTNQARDLLMQVERLNPEQPRLWSLRAGLEMANGNHEVAITDLRKEIQLHPKDSPSYDFLSSILVYYGRQAEAANVWRSSLAVNPDDNTAAMKLATLLLGAKQYSEIPKLLEKPIASEPENLNLQVMRVQALIRGGEKTRGMEEIRAIANKTTKPMILNDLAYVLADTDTSLDLAQDLARRALSQLELECSTANLSSLEDKDLDSVMNLGAAWDTLGWTYYKRTDFAKAERYVQASWQLTQHVEVANHLGDIYTKQGRRAAAIHMWRLALAADNHDKTAQERLRLADAPIIEPSEPAKAGRERHVSPQQELGELRTVKIPGLPTQTGSAEFYLLVSNGKIEDVQYITGSETLKTATVALSQAKYEFSFPDEGPEKIVRRGILSCSEYTKPSCNLTMLLPATARSAWVRDPQSISKIHSNPESTPPSLLSKVEPQYSKEAIQSRIEGTVLLSVTVDKDGAAKNILVIKSLGFGLDEKAVECVAQWHFSPGTKNGKAVDTQANVEVNFRLIKDAQ